MPIYEYYCPACHGRFSHLARTYNEAPPACPRCDNTGVERLVSAASFVRSDAQHTRELREGADQVDADNPAAIARFLKQSGRLADAEGVYGSKTYRELIERRAEGATDADVVDLVDDLSAEMRESDASKMAGAMVFSDSVENRMQADGPPEDHEHEHSPADQDAAPPSRSSADDLGWAH